MRAFLLIVALPALLLAAAASAPGAAPTEVAKKAENVVTKDRGRCGGEAQPCCESGVSCDGHMTCVAGTCEQAAFAACALPLPGA